MGLSFAIILFLSGCSLQGVLGQGVAPCIINSVYTEMGHKAPSVQNKTVASWLRKFNFEGDAIVNSLLTIIEKNLTSKNIIQNQEDAAIVIFGSVGGNGGALFDASLKLARDYNIRNIYVYYVLNYFLPGADDFDACNMLFPNMTAEGIQVIPFDKEDQHLDASILEKADILMDGIVGTGFRRINPSNTDLIDTVKVATAALFELKRVVEAYPDLLVISNDVPSGTQGDGTWDESMRFQFDILLIMEFLKPAPTDAKIINIYNQAEFYWIFYSPPCKTFLDTMNAMIGNGKIQVAGSGSVTSSSAPAPGQTPRMCQAAVAQLGKAMKLEGEGKSFVQVCYKQGIIGK